MRIDGNSRIGGSTARAAARPTADGGFRLDAGGAAPRAAAIAAPLAGAGIEALLALQAAADPTRGRRRQVKRATDMLDTLEAVQADLLVGGIGEGRLNQLMALVGQARTREEPGLDAVIDDIELRVRVELAKRGLFPAG